MTYQYDNYNFHYIVEGGVCFLCMSDQANKHRIPYAFLNDMKARFWAQFGNEEPLQAIAFSYNESFAPILEERMNFYNSEEADQTIDNIGAVKSQIEDVKQVMVQNIEKVRVAKRGLLRFHFSRVLTLPVLPVDLLVYRFWNGEKKSNCSWTRRIVSINKPFVSNHRVAISAEPCIGGRCGATRIWVLPPWSSSW
jgi:hypothetical protein